MPNRISKTKFTPLQRETILLLREWGFGTRDIEKIVESNRLQIRLLYKELGIDNTRPPQKKRFFHQCKICDEIKPIDQFRSRVKNGRTAYECYCSPCDKQYRKEFGKKNYLKNRDVRLKQAEEYRNRSENKKRFREYIPNYIKNRKAIDPQFKLRGRMSTAVGNSLKKRGHKKVGKTFAALGYTPDDLRCHLESLFEPWMCWENHGIYDCKVWDDNNPTTWKWQIDHIVPQSKYQYSSMEEDSFKECWALSNLRPLSAKQNFLDGITKIRH